MDVARVPGRKGFPEDAGSKWDQRKMGTAERAEDSGGREHPELVTDRDSLETQPHSAARSEHLTLVDLSPHTVDDPKSL